MSHIEDGFADVVDKTGGATLTWSSPFVLLGEFDVEAGTIALATGATTIGDLDGGGGVSLHAGTTLTLGFISGVTAEANLIPTDFMGDITGAGTVIIQGGGTQTLSGSNAGSLIVDSGSALLLNGSGPQFTSGINDNGTLLLDLTGNVDLGNLTGNGVLIQEGTDTLTLPAGFDGSITIESGALVLAGDVSDFTGTILDDSALVFAPTGTTSFGGMITGTGSVAFAGSGTLTLNIGISLPDAATIVSGAVLLGDSFAAASNAAGTLAPLGSAIIDDGTLIFANSGNVVEAETISGTGTIVHSGAGTLSLAAGRDNQWEGVFIENAGAVVLGAGTTLIVTDLVGSGGTIFLNGGTLFAAAIDPGFDVSILGPGALAVGDNATFNNRKTIPGVVFGNNDTLVNAQGTTGISPAAQLGGDLIGGSGAVVQNGGSIAGAINITSGSITNLQGGGTLSTGIIQNGVSASGQLSLTNGGTVGGAVTAGANSNVAVTSSTGSIGGGVYLNGGNGAVSNAGTINGPVSVEGSANVAILAGLNEAAGVVDGNVVAGTGLVLSNGGVITGSVSMLNGTVANLQGLTRLGEFGGTVLTAGYIDAGLTSAGALTLTNGGTIRDGVILGSGTVINQAGITKSPAFHETTTTEGYIGGGVTASLGLDLTNQGIIAGRVSMLSGTVSNAGGYFYDRDNLPSFIYSATFGMLEDGVSAAGELSLTNQSTLSGGVTAGAATILNIVENFLGIEQPLLSGGITVSAGLTLQNQGTITGGITAGGSATLTNAAFPGTGQIATITGGIVLQGAASSFTNTGLVTNGITLASGGSIINNIGGTIAAVYDDGPGTVTNNQMIGTAFVSNGATLINYSNIAHIGYAHVGAGGNLLNIPDQTIVSLVDFGTVTNEGVVLDTLTVGASGVLFNTTGPGNAPSVAYVVDDGTVVNNFRMASGVSIAAGGVLTNTGNGYVSGMQDAGTVINYGAMGYNDAVLAGGVLINKSPAGNPFGFLSGGLGDSGTVTNYGVLRYVQISGGGILTNAAGGVLKNENYSSGRVVNNGYIYQMRVSGGTVTNQANGTFGSIILTSPNATLIEAGTIESGIFTAGFSTGIEIDGGGVLQIQPGAVLQEPPGAHAVYIRSGSLTLVTGTTLADIDGRENTGIALLSGPATIGGVHGVSVVTLGAGAVLSAADFSYSFGPSSVAFRGAGTLTGGAILAYNVYNAATLNNSIKPDDGLWKETPFLQAAIGVI